MARALPYLTTGAPQLFFLFATHALGKVSWVLECEWGVMAAHAWHFFPLMVSDVVPR